MSIETQDTMNAAIIAVLEKRTKEQSVCISNLVESRNSQAVTIVELLDERDNWRMVARLSQTLMVICVVIAIWCGYLALWMASKVNT